MVPFNLDYTRFFAILGLMMNFLGSIFIALSVIKNPKGSHQIEGDRKVYIASINSAKFRWGIILLIIGFLIQIVSLIPEVKVLFANLVEFVRNIIKTFIKS